MQLFNADLQPIFIGMQSGKATWTIPKGTFPQLTFMAHLADGNSCYYEDLRTQAVSWTLPFTEMSSAAANTAKVLQSSNEESTVDWINQPFPFDDSIEVMLAIDDYLIAKEQGVLPEDDSESDDSAVEAPSSPAVKESNTRPKSEQVISQIFSAGANQLYEKPAQEAASKSTKDVLDGIDAKMVADDADSDAEQSGSGGTMSSEGDDDEDDHHSEPESQPVSGVTKTDNDGGILTAAQILSQTTLKVTSECN